MASFDRSIMLLVGDLGFSVVERFQQRFPMQFLNVGVAEQNMMGVAAGLASEGHKVFAYSIGNFSTFRPAEQIRNDIDYHELDVTVVSVGGGFSYGSLGYSHHLIQDFGLMRLFPNMTIYSPADGAETVQCMKVLARTKGPSYLRIGKPTYSLTRGEAIQGEGNWVFLTGNQGSKVAIVSTGTALGHAVSFQANNFGGEAAVFTVPIWGMSSKIKQLKFLSNFSEVHTFEDHISDGGFGSWMLEATSKMKQNPPRIYIHAIDAARTVGVVGDASYLEKIGGLHGDKNETK